MNILCFLGFHAFMHKAEDNYMYCTRCGIDNRSVDTCSHSWEYHKEFGITYQELKCRYCNLRKVVEK